MIGTFYSVSELNTELLIVTLQGRLLFSHKQKSLRATLYKLVSKDSKLYRIEQAWLSWGLIQAGTAKTSSSRQIPS